MSETTPPQPQSRFFLWIGLAAGALVAAVVAGAVFLLPLAFASLADNVSDPYGEPLPPPASGDGGCLSTCFTQEDAARLAPSPAALGLLGGIAADPGYATAPPTPIGDHADDAHELYYLANGFPIVCDFALSAAPMSPASPSFYSREDVTIDLGAYGGSDGRVAQVVRVFDSEVYAKRYPSSLTSPIKQCAHYEYSVDGVLHSADVAPTTFDVGDRVASAAWTETSGIATRTIVDLQFGNIAMRTVFERSGIGTNSPTDEDFAEFILETAHAMETLVASPASISDPGSEADCTGRCFSAADAISLAPDTDTLALLGDGLTPAGNSPGKPKAAGAIRDEAEQAWRTGAGLPSWCAFILAQGPVSPASPGTTVDSRNEPIYSLGSFGDENTTVWQTVRVFGSEGAASGYVNDLTSGILDCPHYSVGLDSGLYETDVEFTNFETVSPGIRAVGWNEVTGNERYTVVDTQHGNLVVRTTFYRAAESAIGDEEFASFIVASSAKLQALPD